MHVCGRVVAWEALWVSFCVIYALALILSVADPGIPRGGVPTPEEGAPTYHLQKNGQNLHEHEGS